MLMRGTEIKRPCRDLATARRRIARNSAKGPSNSMTAAV